MKVGYARVSTEEQSLSVQLAQLKAAGCDRIFQEKVSGKTIAGRPAVQKLLGFVGPADVVVVTKLDRLARSTLDLLSIVARIGGSGAAFLSLAEPWADTTRPAGNLIMTVFAGVAQFELERMKERCAAGRAIAKQNGVRFGRSRVLNEKQERLALAALRGGTAPRQVQHDLGVSRSTLWRIKRRAGL